MPLPGDELFSLPAGPGTAPIYFNAGYMDQKTWWRLGLIISFVNIAIWMGIGFPWWKVLGLW